MAKNQLYSTLKTWSLYVQRLLQLDTKSSYSFNKIDGSLFSSIFEQEEHKKGHDVLHSFSRDICSVLSDANKYKDDEALHQVKAANIVRRDMLYHKTEFSNKFHDGFFEKSIPANFQYFACNIEHRVDIVIFK